MITHCIFFLIALIQMSMNGFAGFDFSSNKNSVKNLISQKQSIVLIKDQKDTLKYSGGLFNGIPVNEWKFTFFKGKLNTLTMEIAGTENDRVMYFASLKKYLTKDYGKYTTIDQYDGNMVIKWLFFFPQGAITVSTYLKLSFSKARVLLITTGGNSIKNNN